MNDTRLGGGEPYFEEPDRTSVLAILSLVCALICCIPGLGLVGAGLGVGALVGIGGSGGRVGGKGLAVAGVIVGLFVSALWVGLLIGGRGAVSVFQSGFIAPTNSLMEHVEAGEYDDARDLLVLPAGKTLPDAAFVRFRDAYQAEYGSFTGIPEDFFELMSAYGSAGQAAGRQGPPQGGNNEIPLPAAFDQGMTFMIIKAAQQTPPGATTTPAQQQFRVPIANVIVLLPDGSELSLVTTEALVDAPEAAGGEQAGEPEEADEPNEPGEPGEQGTRP